ncbi:carbohydrate diacid regulator [Paenibacillus sp. UNCCL117]|uniref:CdaR family transcriptional regulator n=1 Tax=unclassified Paenibacillus TaxID=185978 RepID=UPI00089047CC|nr:MULTISPECIES: sugar diacid recognition domain-containing protein [unclassified Paenibacillus]SDE67593.1 transcriptional regulator, CdaR family [Paenibacillus sp. cl123]SFW70744.1 carbohydrate diacid regulator [Paenibacillus sp. UNCCL117]
MILEQIAQTIVDNTSDIIGYPIIITDEKGSIIGSTDRSRLGSLHTATIDVLRKNQPVSYEEADAQALENVLPGIATPIVVGGKVIGVLGIAGIPHTINKYVQLVKSHVELMFHESFKKETTVLESKALDTLVQYLLYSSRPDEAAPMLEYGKMLGYRFDLDRICVIIEMDLLSLQRPDREGGLDKHSLPYFQRELIEQIKHLFADHRQDIFSLLNLEQFIVLKAVLPHERDTIVRKLENRMQRLNQFLQGKHQAEAAVALGNVKHGVNGIKESYENAVRTLKVGKRSLLTAKFYNYNDWELTLELLTKELTPYIIDKLTGQLGELRNHGSYETLASTFLSYCKCNMNLSETARTLFIHRNTLLYRLDKISELTGLDLSTFEHCLLLYVAIKNGQHQ